jgi:hypothetical protein
MPQYLCHVFLSAAPTVPELMPQYQVSHVESKYSSVIS